MVHLVGTHSICRIELKSGCDIPKMYPRNPGVGDARVPAVQHKGLSWISSTHVNPGHLDVHWQSQCFEGGERRVPGVLWQLIKLNE